MRKRFYLILGALALALVAMPVASYAGGGCCGDKKCDTKKDTGNQGGSGGSGETKK